MDEAIRIERLTKTFGGGRRALDEVALTVMPGEMVALIGASGSGKSTLMRHMAGFVAADLQPGGIDILGRPIQRDGRIVREVRQIRRDIGFVFQQFNLVGRMPVITNVLTGLLARVPLWRSLLFRFTPAERQAAMAALAEVGIADLAFQRASTLSGGQQQRAALARTLVQGAKIILADEPIASLDPESARKVMDMLARMNRDHKLTVVVSLHQVDVAMRYCVRTVALHQGRVVYDGPSAALTPDLLRRLYGVQASELLNDHVDHVEDADDSDAADASPRAAGTAPANAQAPFLTSMSLSLT
ncbi:phosphonate ABC transporter ATP-binding protein [Pandoraea cepalis]|uniref:Phosphonate ABC transporter ATP-binding protein n=1 Tax=Pandoraea cepalis TaxID=2508294 RepID=A0AAW7MSH3_9BURK|nr:phosphonate ABC transporter ATP-binding protein [Pandoraea cepalis]MDN4575733.1 phosphonate ABC transporter ATP-binding protein [Pandoraea cepalis]MDN4580835.1 phosphonate ABC transporter ATP-binding protein [Pandoraea cepalis]